MDRILTIALISLPSLAASLWLICYALAWLYRPGIPSPGIGGIIAVLLIIVGILVIAFIILLVFAGFRFLWRALAKPQE